MDQEMQDILDRLKPLAKKECDYDPSVYPESLIGKKVIVNSYRVSGAVGVVSKYLPSTHHYWVWLSKPIKKKGGGKTQWHKCNAGNCRLFQEGVDDIEQLTLNI